MPFRSGLNLFLIILKSGRNSGFSAQHSTKQPRMKSNVFSSWSNGGLSLFYEKKGKFFHKFFNWNCIFHFWIVYLNGDIPESLAITFFSISAADSSVIPNGPWRPCNSYSTMANEYTSPFWKSWAVGSPRRVERNNSGALYNNPVIN